MRIRLHHFSEGNSKQSKAAGPTVTRSQLNSFLCASLGEVGEQEAQPIHQQHLHGTIMPTRTTISVEHHKSFVEVDSLAKVLSG